MRIAYAGNFGAPFSTENEVLRALASHGHRVTALQENAAGTFAKLGKLATGHEVDFILWTRTKWTPSVPDEDQWQMLFLANKAGVPTVFYHLDRWHGLARESEITTEPCFRCDLVCTADGGHDEEWKAAGIEHVWFPPAVDATQAEALGTPKPEYASDIAFVGSWRPGYHPEWPHRAQLVDFLRQNYGDQVKFWPRKNEPAIRGPALADLYQSVKVVVGDSCLAGGATAYWSDRCPETIGRGGYLIHPYVEGLDRCFGLLHVPGGGDFIAHMDTWELGDWASLKRQIDWALEHDAQRKEIAAAGRTHVLAHHTYATRMATLADLLVERGMIGQAL